MNTHRRSRDADRNKASVPNSSAQSYFASNNNNNNEMSSYHLSTIPVSNLSRPASLARSSPSSPAGPVNHERRLQNSSATIPSSNILLSGLNLSSLLTESSSELEEATTASVVPIHPRRLWKVSDTKLPTLPPFYPPCNPHTCCLVSDVSPSVVAIRIAECLRRRSVAVEYDEEAATALCLTVDRCAFTVHLYAGRGGQVLVECMRTQGPAQTFYWTVRAILQAARSLDSGDDHRLLYQASPIEYVRWPSQQPPQQTVASSAATKSPQEISASALQSLEHACDLVHKDRVGAQRLGFESLVALTDATSVGVDAALYASLALLGAPLDHTSFNMDWFFQLIVEQRIPGEPAPAPAPQLNNNSTDPTLFACHSFLREPTDNDPQQQEESRCDDFHAGILRSLGLRALTNALVLLAQHQPGLLQSLLQTRLAQWTGPEIVQALTNDLQGASRPPAVVRTHSWASPHEAAMAVQCLGVLGAFSDKAQKHILANESTLARLERLRSVGRSTHDKLYELASRVYDELTQKERSC